MSKKSRSWIALACSGLLAAACGAPQPAAQPAPPELISRGDILGNPDRSTVRISPNGERLSYLAPVDGVLNVWVGTVDDPQSAKPVTDDTKRGIRRYFWAFDNRHIIYLQDVGGDENWRAYSVDLDSGEERDLTPFDDVQVRLQETSHLFPDEILITMNRRDPRVHDVYRLDLVSGELELIEENPGYTGFVTDENHRVRLGTMMTPDGGMTIFAKSAEGWDEFLKVGRDDTLTTGPVAFDKTGERCYMVDSRDRDTAALVAVNLETGELEIIYENDRADVDNTIVHPTEQTVQAASSTFLRREWEVFDDAIRGDLEYLGTVADGELEVISRSLDDERWIVGFELSNRPYSYYLYDRSAGEAKFLFSNRQKLVDAELARMHSVAIPSRDGLELVSYYTLPVESDADGDGKPLEPQPLVLNVHGGPWGRDQWGYNGIHQWLANRGYAVLSVNFRGSTGLGKGFTNAGDHEWGGKMHDDLIDAVEWAVAEGIADGERIAIMGGSYGGYAVLAGLTFTPESFACGVDIVGPSNLITLMESIPPYWKPLFELFAARLGDPRTEEGRALLTERSPLSHVEKISRPLLIGQGANDPRVKQAESDQIVTAMKEKGIPVTYVLFPDEGHGFARPENRLAFNAVAEAFLAECLGGRAEPIGGDFTGSSIQVPAGADQIEGLAETLGSAEQEEAAAGG